MVHPFIEELATQIAIFITKAILGLFVFVIFWRTRHWVRGFVLRTGRERNLDEDLINLLEQSTMAGWLIFGVVTCLDTLGIDVAAIVAGLGLTGFALGFAFKDTLSNLLAGLMIVIYEPFDNGDYIEVGGFKGLVDEINLRYTELRTDDKRILIPNATVFNNAIILKRDNERPPERSRLIYRP